MTFLAFLGLAAALAFAQETGTVAFIGVHVVPMDEERVLPDQTVVIRDGIIAAIGSTALLSVPEDAIRIEGRGRYLLPGLADMHAHLSGYVTDTDSDKDAIARSEMLLYVATGVTLVRNMAGSDAHLEYRRRVEAGELVGPRIFTVTNIVDGPNPVWPSSIRASEPADADGLVESFLAAGYDQIKIYNGLPRDVYGALFDAAARRGIRIVGHVPFSIGIDGALEAGQYSIEHQRGYDYDGVRKEALEQNGGRNAERFGSWQKMSDDRMRELVRRTVAAGTWNCPTFVVDYMLSDNDARAAFRGKEALRFVHPEVRKTLLKNELDDMFPEDANEALRLSFPQRYKLLKMLSDAGAGLLVGTDTMVPYLVPGYTPIDEMQHFVKAGLTPYQALRAATSDPARFLGIGAESGTVSVGKRADLLLVEANPLEEISHLWRRVGVVLAGRWLPQAELDAMLERMAASYPSNP
jgi:imidazolonepropionase-like amidohydrolase